MKIHIWYMYISYADTCQTANEFKRIWRRGNAHISRSSGISSWNWPWCYSKLSKKNWKSIRNLKIWNRVRRAMEEKTIMARIASWCLKWIQTEEDDAFLNLSGAPSTNSWRLPLNSKGSEYSRILSRLIRPFLVLPKMVMSAPWSEVKVLKKEDEIKGQQPY